MAADLPAKPAKLDFFRAYSVALNAEALKEVRNSARDVLKFDFLVVASVITVMTFLKLDRFEVMKYIAQFVNLSLVFMCIVVLDFALYSHLSQAVVNSLESGKRITLDAVTRWVIRLQGWPNGICVTLLITYMTAYPTGVMHALTSFSEEAEIKDQIDAYVSKNGKSPASLDEVTKSSPKFSSLLSSHQEKVEYKKTTPKGYSLTFVSLDGKYRLEVDDRTRMHEIYESRKRALSGVQVSPDLPSEQSERLVAGSGGGWYLLSPPMKSGANILCVNDTKTAVEKCGASLVDMSAPLSRWDQESSFDTAAQCKKHIADQLEVGRGLLDTLTSEPRVNQVVAHFKVHAIENDRCIGTGDVRLGALAGKG